VPVVQVGVDRPLNTGANFDGRRIAAQAEVRLFAPTARRAGEGNDVLRNHGVPAGRLTRVGHQLPGLDQQPAVRKLVIVLLKSAITASQFDDLVHLIEGQIAGATAELDDQIPGLFGTRCRRTQLVMNRQSHDVRPSVMSR